MYHSERAARGYQDGKSQIDHMHARKFEGLVGTGGRRCTCGGQDGLRSAPPNRARPPGAAEGVEEDQQRGGPLRLHSYSPLYPQRPLLHQLSILHSQDKVAISSPGACAKVLDCLCKVRHYYS